MTTPEETNTPAEQPRRLPEHMRSPIDRAIASRNRPGRSPHPEPGMMTDTRRVEMPIDHSPDNIKDDGQSARLAKDAMTSIWNAWGAIKTAAEDPGTNLATLGNLSQRALERGLASADRAIASIEGQIAGIEKQITAAVQPHVSDTLAAEIRSHWQRAAADPKSLQDLMSAVRIDPRTSSAVLGAPPYLSGLKDHEMVRQNAVLAHAPEQQASLDEARKALTKVTAARDRSMQSLGPRIASWKDPQPTALRQLREIANGKS